jgi:hypothetical protein
LIKELPSLVPLDEVGAKAPEQRARAASNEGIRPASPDSADSGTPGNQRHGDKTTEAKRAAHESLLDEDNSSEKVDRIGKSPGEVAFFKLLHAEFNKAEHFFEKAQQEFVIREERVREGMDIMKQPNSIMVNEKWSLLAKSLYRLYKDLLLLETFAIMTYCSFSKILKKHDKVTGYNTRNAFMANVVNNANFTNYPVVLEMISRCERLYEEVSEHLLKEGKENLYEDERLFINMIHRLNEQVLDTAEIEGVPERKEVRRPAMTPKPGNQIPLSAASESKATSSLRSLVEENDKKFFYAAQVSEGLAGVDGDDSFNQKRNVQVSEGLAGVDGDDSLNQKRKVQIEAPDGKRQRTDI